MSKGSRGVPHADVRTAIANHPGITVVGLTERFRTTRAAMSRRLTDLFKQGEVVKKPYGKCEPVGWFISGTRLP